MSDALTDLFVCLIATFTGLLIDAMFVAFWKFVKEFS